jgi:hypothetical protein
VVGDADRLPQVLVRGIELARQPPVACPHDQGVGQVLDQVVVAKAGQRVLEVRGGGLVVLDLVGGGLGVVQPIA